MKLLLSLCFAFTASAASITQSVNVPEFYASFLLGLQFQGHYFDPFDSSLGTLDSISVRMDLYRELRLEGTLENAGPGDNLFANAAMHIVLALPGSERFTAFPRIDVVADCLVEDGQTSCTAVNSAGGSAIVTVSPTQISQYIDSGILLASLEVAMDLDDFTRFYADGRISGTIQVIYNYTPVQTAPEPGPAALLFGLGAVACYRRYSDNNEHWFHHSRSEERRRRSHLRRIR
jgi:hypothetical protein